MRDSAIAQMRKSFLTTAILVIIAQCTSNLAQSPRANSEKREEPNPSLVRAKSLLSLIESRSPSAAAEVKKALSDKDWYVRGQAVLLLPRVDPKAAAADLPPLLSDESWFVRDAALQALSNLSDPAIAPSVTPLLSNPDAHTRASAASALGRMKESASAAALIKLLDDEDDEVRRASAVALGRLKAPDASDALMKLLGDQSPSLKKAAAWALSNIGDKRADQPILAELKAADPEDAWQYAADLHRIGNVGHLEIITGALNSENPRIRQEALGVLGELGNNNALPAIIELKNRTSDPAFKIEIARTLGRFNAGQALTALIAMLSDGDPRVRATAVAALGDAKKAHPDYDSAGLSVTAIVSTLKKEQSDIVLSALADSLSLLDRTKTTDELLNSLGGDARSDERIRKALELIDITPATVAARAKGSDPAERARALELLGRLGGRNSADLLIETVRNEKDPHLRSKASSSLGMLRDRRGVDSLITAAAAPEAEVRVAAVTALARIGDHAASDALFAAARDADDRVRGAAVQALETLGISVQRVTPDLSSGNWQVRAAAITTLSRLGDPRAVPLLIASLKDKEPRVRVEGIRSLSAIGDKRAVDPLIGALGDTSSDVRFQAAAALGDLKDTRAVGPLSALINDRDLRVSATAAEALARMEDPRAIRLMLDSLGSGDWRTRARAAQVLARIPERSFPEAAVGPLVKALRDGDLVVRYYASEALVAAAAPAVGPLVGLMRSGNGTERERAARVLLRIGPAAADSLIQLALDKTAAPETRLEAARVLGGMRESRAVEPLLPLLRDSRFFLRQQAARCLGQIGAPAIVPLIELARSSPPATREVAFEALGIAVFVAKNLRPAGANMPGSVQAPDQTNLAPALSALIEGLTDGNAAARSASARAIGEAGDEAGVAPLMQLLLDETSPIRSLAATSLSKLGKPALQRLINALDDRRPSVRILSAQALGDMKSSEAVPSLVRLAAADRSPARADAIEALGKIGDVAALDPILVALADGSVTVRRKALASISHFQDQRAVQALVASIGDLDDECRQAAAGGLGEIGNHHVIPLLERLADGDKNSDVRAAAVAAIGRIRAQFPDDALNPASRKTPK